MRLIEPHNPIHESGPAPARSIAPARTDEPDDPPPDLLGEVTLKRFEATPRSLRPFQTSVLRWQVDAPTGVSIKLNGATVAKSGSKSVQPSASQMFRLYAHVGRFSKFLGAVTVNVDVSQCASRDSTIVDELLNLVLSRKVEESDEVYFRIVAVNGPDGRPRYMPSRPQILVSPGRIRFKLKLAGKVDNFPDPDIDIDASFGLAVVPSSNPVASLSAGTQIVPTGVEVSVKVSFPWWAYLIPGAALGLPIAAGMAQDRAHATFTSGIEEFVSDVVGPHFDRIAPPGSEAHRVRIYLGDFGPTVEVDYCPVAQPEVVQ